MVQAKDSARRLVDSLREHAERFDKNNPVIKERWCVIEVTPSRYVHDPHGGFWTDVQAVTVSPYFDKKKEASEWMGRHEPDKGKRLEIRHEKLRRYTYEKWGTV